MGIFSDLFGSLVGTEKAAAKPEKKPAKADESVEIAKPTKPRTQRAAKPAAAKKAKSSRAPKALAFKIPERPGNARVVLPRASIERLKEVVMSTPRPSSYVNANKTFVKCGRIVSRSGSFEFYVTTLDEAVCFAEPGLDGNKSGRGEFLLDFELIKAVAKQKPAVADFVVDDGKIDVEAYKSSTHVISTGGRTEDLSDFPHIPGPSFPQAEVEGLFAAILEAKQFRSSDGGRYAMNCVHVDAASGYVVATDGKRMHRTEFKPKGDLPFTTANISVEMKFKPGRPFSVSGKEKVAWSNDTLYLIFPTGFWASRVSNGEFPPWRDVMPSAADYTLEWRIDEETKDSLVEALKSCPARKDSLALRITFLDDAVRFEMNDPEASYDFTIRDQTIVNEKNKAVEIGLNPRLLLDILQNARLDTIRVKDAKQAVLFEGDRLFHVLMPIQIV